MNSSDFYRRTFFIQFHRAYSLVIFFLTLDTFLWVSVILNSKVRTVNLSARHVKFQPWQTTGRGRSWARSLPNAIRPCCFSPVKAVHPFSFHMHREYREHHYAFMRSTCLTVKCIPSCQCVCVCDKEREHRQDGINLHVSHLRLCHPSSPLFAPCSSPFRHMKDPCVSVENKWVWPSSDAHGLDPLFGSGWEFFLLCTLHFRFWRAG